MSPLILQENTPVLLPSAALSEAEGRELWERFGTLVGVEFPSPRTSGQWRLSPLNRAGMWRLSSGRRVRIEPRVPLPNVFRMWREVDALPVRFLASLEPCRTLDEVCQTLAQLFAERVLRWSRRGLSQAYRARDERLMCVRGRLQVAPLAREPWLPSAPCRFHERSADTAANRRLLRALSAIEAGAWCAPAVLPLVQAARATLREAGVEEAAPPERERLLDSRDADERLLHALATFFLHHTGPGENGEGALMPAFLCDMERLFERFVAGWLSRHLPASWKLSAQEHWPLPASQGAWSFRPDLVLRQRDSGRITLVADTKYRFEARPSAEELAQVVAYATALGCHEAVLIFPMALPRLVELRVGNVRVRALGFELDGDLAAAGRRVMREMVE